MSDHRTRVAMNDVNRLASTSKLARSTSFKYAFCFNQIEKCRHGIAHRFPARGNIPGISQIDRSNAIARQGRGQDQTGCNGWLEELPLPFPVVRSGNRSRVSASQHFGHAAPFTLRTEAFCNWLGTNLRLCKRCCMETTALIAQSADYLRRPQHTAAKPYEFVPCHKTSSYGLTGSCNCSQLRIGIWTVDDQATARASSSAAYGGRLR